MKKTFISRLFVLIILALAVTCVFTSCIGAPSAQKVTINNVQVAEGSTLTQSELNAIATLVRNNPSAWSDFVAAYRGYDVVNGPEQDSYPTLVGDDGKNLVHVEGAKAVLAKYDTGKTLKYDTLTAADVKNIVDAMKYEVSFEADRDLLENVRFYIGAALGWITNTIGFGSYIIGICIFAIVVELCMLPLTIRQQKNSIKQANLRPKEMAIRNRYKGRNDQATQQKVAQEIQDLYQRENFNPMSGCLPLLIQLPIVMLLYNIVVDPIQYVLGGTASFVSAIKTFFTASRAAGGLGLTLHSTNGSIEVLSQLGDHDFSNLANFDFFSNSGKVFETLETYLESIPSFNIGDINFGLTPSLERNFALLIVPVLTFVVYFFSMKLTKKFTYQPTQNENAPGAGCSTKMMDWYMPLVSVFFSFAVPGAVGIYWVFRSVLSTIKSFIMSKVMPIPRFTEEDYKAAEKELNSKRPQRKRKNASELDPNRERPRSLHHIDDEDYE